MIRPDINLLVSATNQDAPIHKPAVRWWEDVINRDIPVGLPWVVVRGYVRIMTAQRILVRPMVPGVGRGHVRSWLEQSSLDLLEPGPRHLDVMDEVFLEIGLGGRLITDIHLSALAIETPAQLYSNDRDFGRFSRLRWVNPIE